ncbi:hypothetical protein [Endozoicomonas sp. ALB091]|uniref:hypothetical protein n=1 Tax=Endozoicomonas sp. ALB091 TaxID=3403073 RepID=UPI003BB5CA90
MKPDQREWLDEHQPDHHLKYDDQKNIWYVLATTYGTKHPFPSTKYKSPDNAKAAAIAFRDSLPAEAFKWERKFLSQTNSNFAGVRRYRDDQRDCWMATVDFYKGGERSSKSKSFSIKKYGEQQGYDMAVQWRKRMMLEKENIEAESSDVPKVKETYPKSAGRMP